MAVHFRNPFLVIGLVVPAPVRQFLFVSERFPPALPAHDHFHLRGQLPDERSDSPSLRTCLSILTFVAILSFVLRVPVCIFKLKPDCFVHLIEPINVAGSKFERTLTENLFHTVLYCCQHGNELVSNLNSCNITLVWVSIIVKPDNPYGVFFVVGKRDFFQSCASSSSLMASIMSFLSSSILSLKHMDVYLTLPLPPRSLKERICMSG